jgi:antitoxin component of RelBE/YafQ-DinJ toxin-antitoxin module
MKERKQIRLDEQSQEDARRIAERYNLGSTSAAIRFALREVARQIETNVAPNVANVPKDRTDGSS